MYNLVSKLISLFLDSLLTSGATSLFEKTKQNKKPRCDLLFPLMTSTPFSSEYRIYPFHKFREAVGNINVPAVCSTPSQTCFLLVNPFLIFLCFTWSLLLLQVLKTLKVQPDPLWTSASFNTLTFFLILILKFLVTCLLFLELLFSC